MILKRFSSSFAAICAIAMLSGCGSGSSDTSSTATTAAASGAPAMMSGTHHGYMAKPLAKAVPVPADLHCTGDVVVWVNLKTKSFHESTDPYFGRTVDGKYMCKADAVTAGDHAAGSMRSHRHSPAPDASPGGD
ncbi:MAG TPA: hypothetical protein VII69_09045 [Candidatus Eremiobacteraceae bacterium]